MLLLVALLLLVSFKQLLLYICRNLLVLCKTHCKGCPAGGEGT